jgi:hypothetical protein
MKKCLYVLLIIWLLSACGKGGSNPTDIIDPVTDSLISLPENIASAEDDDRMTVTWGYCNIPGNDEFDNTNLPDESRVIQYLNNYFGVMLEGFPLPFENFKRYGEWEHLTVLPDIFIVSGESQPAYDTGLFRSIPRPMIERYAPRYAALLDSELNGWEANQTSRQDEYMGLISYYSAWEPQLMIYSVYRLDWLESAGFVPPGQLIHIGNRVYFTETAFDMQHFTRAMRIFAEHGESQSFGLSLPRSNSLEYVFSSEFNTLAGAWGLDIRNFKENGKLNVYYASERYREFLLFLRELYEREHLGIIGTVTLTYHAGGSSISTTRPTVSKGWWSSWINMLLDDEAWYAEHRNVLNRNASARILITPPEIGWSNLQGASGSVSEGNFFSMGRNLFMVPVSITDEKLAKILEIYDTMAFDPDLAMIAEFGFEWVDYEWTGEPFDSFVRVKAFDREYYAWSDSLDDLADKLPFNNGTHLLSPNISYGNVRKAIYRQNVDTANPLYVHSKSAEAQAMIILPYKEDRTGAFAEELAQWGWGSENHRILDEIAADYFFDAITGEVGIHSSWDAYIKKLNENGLQAYLAMLDKLPEVER